jgi:hypothetical protein
MYLMRCVCVVCVAAAVGKEEQEALSRALGAELQAVRDHAHFLHANMLRTIEVRPPHICDAYTCRREGLCGDVSRGEGLCVGALR